MDYNKNLPEEYLREIFGTNVPVEVVAFYIEAICSLMPLEKIKAELKEMQKQHSDENTDYNNGYNAGWHDCSKQNWKNKSILN